MASTLRPDGKKIRSLRLQKGWPQDHLAQVAEVSPRTIQRVESGGNASFETMRSIASAFELDVHELSQPAVQAAETKAPEGSGSSQKPVARQQDRTPSGHGIFAQVMKPALGAVMLVLLAAFGIRLIPYLTVADNPDTRIANSVPAPMALGLS